MKEILVSKKVSFSNALPFGLIAGPCVLESHELALTIAVTLQDICGRLKIPYVFKASFDKANRTSAQGTRGMAWKDAADIFRAIKRDVGCPVLTDVHWPEQCALVAQDVDVLQIPAFLCRQTDLIAAAVATGKIVQIKKGQFLSPQEMLEVARKAESFGAQGLLLCERGTSFGYNRLINDFKGISVMAQSQWPVIFDATHSVQCPGGLGGKSGGERQHVEALARAAVAVGVAGIFMETHPDPATSPSDGPNMVPLASMESLLATLKRLDGLSKSLDYQKFSQGSFHSFEP